MITQSFNFLHSCQWRVLSFILLIRAQSFGLNSDGALLLSFKQTILTDPFNVLQSWNSQDDTPCSWAGVTCGVSGSSDAYFRVTGLSLPGFGLRGPIPSSLGMIEHLRNLNLSNNLFNGSILSTLVNAHELQIVDLSNNLISGEIPANIVGLKNLEVINLSDNSLTGNLPGNLTTLQNLTVISMKNNYLYGPIPGGFNSVRVLDLSSNLINGSLPRDFGGSNIALLNVSFNRISSEISTEFASNIPINATIDLSFNNLTGPIPELSLFTNQNATSYYGNPGLCGELVKSLCPVASSIAKMPGATSPDSPPAIAAIPKTRRKRTGIRTEIILAIVIGDVAGIAILVVVFLCVYNRKRRKNREDEIKKEAESAKEFDWTSPESSPEESDHTWLRTWTCLDKAPRAAADENDDDRETHAPPGKVKNEALVTFDRERELELESLLKASAYVLGASGSSIMYKAVLEDGTAVAVRRIGENGAERFRDFKNQVGVIAKLVHPNLVRIRGFYWGSDEKLIVYDFVPNGSLANARQRRPGSSPYHLPWELRLKIAIGVARGLCYIHEKKHVHGNLKPSNILLGPDMEPKIGDFGLERLVTCGNSSKGGGSARNFGSKRSTTSRDSLPDLLIGPSPSVLSPTPYHAPESLRSLKPNPKWDVFSFGVVLLELLTGKVIALDETGPGLLAIGSSTSADEDKGKVLRIADMAIRADMEGKEDALLALVKLGYGCISHLPQKRPSMKEVLQALEKFPSSSCSSLYY